MSVDWLRHAERGTPWITHFYAWLSLRLGRPFSRVLLHLICAYFFVFSRGTVSASQAYISLIRGRPARLGEVYRHHYVFASSVHDRLYFLSDRIEKYDIRVSNAALIDSLAARRQGCILLGSHLGSFEVLRAVGVLQQDLPIKVLHYPDNARRLNRLFDSLNPTLAETYIDLGAPSAMLAVKEHVDRGGMVGILGDRAWQKSRQVRLSFLGRPANFPLGPMQLAGVLGVPVVMFFGLYRGGRRYDIHFELLAERIVADRKVRDQVLGSYVERYAEVLEGHCRRAPFNWFNFYNFWETESDEA